MHPHERADIAAISSASSVPKHMMHSGSFFSSSSRLGFLAPSAAGDAASGARAEVQASEDGAEVQASEAGGAGAGAGAGAGGRSAEDIAMWPDPVEYDVLQVRAAVDAAPQLPPFLLFPLAQL